jgi:ABC-type nickel/cobalt efflux system permease component RcnA
VFGLDDKIAVLSDGASVWLVLAAAILLGLRHATDPDHLAAVTTLVASGKDRAGRAAGRLGLFWGLGHALTLFAFGLPIVIANQYLPERAQQVAESVIAVVIVALAVRLIRRWHAGFFHVHVHEHGGDRHAHLHSHGESQGHKHAHRSARTRTPLGAFSIGLVHGLGGSAGVGVLIVASVQSTPLAVVSLGLLAVFTAVSMWAITTGFGRTLVSRPLRSAFNVAAPAIGVAGLSFGVWYGMAAWDAAWYPF